MTVKLNRSENCVAITLMYAILHLPFYLTQALQKNPIAVKTEMNSTLFFINMIFTLRQVTDK